MVIPTLIAKLEQAEGGSRELDAEIQAYVLDGYIEPGNFHDGKQPSLIWHQDNGVKIASISGHPWRDRKLWGNADQSANFTASIDAALTLIPEGRSCSILVDTTDASATVFDPEEGDGEIQHAHASTPALAIAIAALKARLAEQEIKG